jgi:Tol biopolymer transport system component
MLTGKQVFTGDTVSDTLASVLAREPEWQSLPANLHPRIRLLLERCLKKYSKDRYSGISDARVDIEEVLTDSRGVYLQPATVVGGRSRMRAVLPWIVVIILVGAIVGLVVRQPRVPEPQIIRYGYDLPESQQFAGFDFPALAISPDGQKFVYATPEGLYLHYLNELNARVISGTNGNSWNPFFSPDGKWIGYFSLDDKKLKTISIDGGAPVPLCDVAMSGGAHWYEDTNIVYSDALGGGIYRVSTQGGTPESLVKTEGNFLSFPQVLPDGKTIIYTSNTGTDFNIWMKSLVSGDAKELFPGTSARYLPTGHIVYELPGDNNLFAVPFSLDRLSRTGGEIHLLEGVLQRGGCAQYAISDSGTLAYLPGSAVDPNSQRTLVWVDRNGEEEPIGAPPMFYKYPNISPDGTKIAVTDYAGLNHNIYIWDLVRKRPNKLTLEGKDNLCPVWSPDGERIAFWSYGLYCTAANGTGQNEKLGGNLVPYCWPGNVNAIVGVEMASAHAEYIAMLSMEGNLPQKTILQKAPVQRSPKISRKERWMAYTSNTSGRDEIYVVSFPEADKGPWQVSQGGGAAPLWSPDGRELFYLNGESVLSCSIETEPVFIPGNCEELFQGTFIVPLPGEGTPWDILPDGKKFLMIKPGKSEDPSRKINVVFNWFEELKEKLPVP